MHSVQEGTHTRSVSLSAFKNAAQGAVIVFSLDRVTKTFISELTIERLPIPKGLVTLVHHENFGIIANVPLPLAITVAITAFVIVLVLGATWTAIKEGKARQAGALGVLLGGAVGNLFDRVTQGYVFDWILLFGRSAINLADIAIVLGALWYFILRRNDDQREIASGTGERMP